MTAASLHHPVSTANPAPVALLWPQDAPLDPGQSIPQNRPNGAAAGGADPVPSPIEIAALTETLTLNIWCPPAYQARLETVLLPFGDRIEAVMKMGEGAEPDPAEFTAAANEPSLVFFGGLSDTLAMQLAAQTHAEGGEDLPILPRPVPDIVQDWCAQSEALLAAVQGARKHITLIPAETLLDRPEAVTEAVARRYGLPFEPRDMAQSVTQAVPRGQPPHFALMASSIAQTAPKIGMVLDQLAEASLEVPGSDLRRQQSPAVLQRLLIEADTLHGAERNSLRQEYDRDLRRVEALAEARLQRLRHQADAARLALLERDVLSTRLSEEAAQNDAAASYLKEELTRREATYAAQVAEIDLLRATATQLETARKAVSLKGNRLERDVGSLSRNIQMRDDRIAGLAQALVGYEDEALALRDEVAGLHDEVSALRRSTSWRLTAPVRGVSLVLRKILRRG